MSLCTRRRRLPAGGLQVARTVPIFTYVHVSIGKGLARIPTRFCPNTCAIYDIVSLASSPQSLFRGVERVCPKLVIRFGGMEQRLRAARGPANVSR